MTRRCKSLIRHTIFYVFLSMGLKLCQAASVDPVLHLGPEQVPPRNLNDNPTQRERVILFYTVDGCRSFSSESADNTGHVELQSPKRAREVALSELENRVNRVLQADFGTSPNVVVPFPRMLEEVGPITSDIWASNQQSIKLESRYLHALQVEVTDVPKLIPKKTMVSISDGLPCVDMVFGDERKLMLDRLVSNSTAFAESQSGSELIEPLPANYASRVASILPNQERNLQGSRVAHSVVPNDPLYKEQWHLTHPSWGINLQKAWGEMSGDGAMIVAIIDSGCDLNHPDIKAKKWINRGEICGDGIDNDKNGYVDDCHGWDWVDNDNNPAPAESGHGTAAAGIIAAATGNRLGIAAICWQCQIMCLRFIDGVEGNVSDQVAAIDYATKMGAKISNNSYGGYGFSKLEYEVIKRARSYGHLFVSSAGNNNYDTDLPQYDHTPSTYKLDNVLAVGASTSSGTRASFSNFGLNSVDFFAPGSRIVTTEMRGGYAIVSGTSFAAPMGAAAAALVWSRFPTLSHTEVIQSLRESCKKTEALKHLAVCGGVMDVSESIQTAEIIARRKDQTTTTAAKSRIEPTTTKPASSSGPSGVNSGSSAGVSTSNQTGRLAGVSASPSANTAGAPAPAAGLISAFLSGFTRSFSRSNEQPEEGRREPARFNEASAEGPPLRWGMIQWLESDPGRSVEAPVSPSATPSPVISTVIETKPTNEKSSVAGKRANANPDITTEREVSASRAQQVVTGTDNVVRPFSGLPLLLGTQPYQTSKAQPGVDLLRFFRTGGIYGIDNAASASSSPIQPGSVSTPQLQIISSIIASSRQRMGANSSSNSHSNTGVEKVLNTFVSSYPAIGQQLQLLGPLLKTALGVGSSASPT